MIIDVSEWQGKIDWEKVKPQIEGAILRCGLGSNIKKQDDKFWEYNSKQCQALGIPYGVYLYSYADSEAKARSEAEHVLRLIKGKTLSYPVFYDLEEHRYGKYARKMYQIFSKIIKAAGYKCGLYTGESYYNSYLSGIDADILWIAKYSSHSPVLRDKATYQLWQYTSKGQVAGVPGGKGLVDCSKRMSGSVTATTTSTKTVWKEVNMPTVQNHDKGTAVYLWQCILCFEGFKITRDGFFGNATAEATKQLQKKIGVNADGAAGPKTYAAYQKYKG